MQVLDLTHDSTTSWDDQQAALAAFGPHLILVFGGPDQLRSDCIGTRLLQACPQAVIAGCSTSGEISGQDIFDNSIVLTAVRFSSTTVHAVQRSASNTDSYALGVDLVRALPQDGLQHVLVFADGLCLNGSALAEGMSAALPPGVQVTGGLAGDEGGFVETLVVSGTETAPASAVAVGFYGDRLMVGYGSHGGWDPFGPERTITKSAGKVLMELDHQPALDVYKRYLGAHAAGLPGTGLLFPLTIQESAASPPLVRSILAVNDAEGSLTFAGEMPLGARARLMKSSFDRLVDGAMRAATMAAPTPQPHDARLAILVSCVGRRLVLKQRTEEELEAVQDVLGPNAHLTGFYSFGEICPIGDQAYAHLHNQTMTITVLEER